MQTGNVAALKNPAAATKPAEHYEPTTVTTTTAPTVPTEQPADKPYAPFGLPVWGFGVCMGVLAFLILITVIVNVYEIQLRKPQEIAVEEEPEEERFLTKAEMEQEQRNNEGGADE